MRLLKKFRFEIVILQRRQLYALQQSGIQEIILPKKDKLNKEQNKEKAQKEFKKLRKASSAIKRNINMPEHHGLNRWC